MRALVFRGPWDLRVETRADPSPLSADVLIRVIATGICGSDIHGFTGATGRRHAGQIMGHEIVGRVEELGRGLDKDDSVVPGALVTVNPVIACRICPACRSGNQQSCTQCRIIGVDADISSGFADLISVPTANVVPLPTNLTPEYGALVEPLSVGYHAAIRGACRPEDTVLVIGGGPIGQACALAALRLGVDRVVVSEPVKARRDLLTAIDVPTVDPNDGDLSRSVPERLGTPASLVLDAVGTSASLADATSCSSPGARIVLVGMNEANVEIAAYTFSTAERSLIGSFCYSAGEFEETAAWVGGSPQALERLIDGRVDLDGAPGSFSALANGDAIASKVLVFPAGVRAA